MQNNEGLMASFGIGTEKKFPEGRFSIDQAVIYLTSREVIYKFLDELSVAQHLYPLAWDEEEEKWLDEGNILFTPWKVYQKYIRDHLQVRLDKQTKLVSISIRDGSAEKTAEFIINLIRVANREARLNYLERANKQIDIFQEHLAKNENTSSNASTVDLLEYAYKNKLWAETHKDFLFEFVDFPVTPLERVAPARTRMVLLGTTVGFIISLILVLGIELFRERDDK